MAYFQVEKESLVITSTCKHFHLFLYGKSFTVVTYHQALLTIYSNITAKMPLYIENHRLERIRILLISYLAFTQKACSQHPPLQRNI